MMYRSDIANLKSYRLPGSFIHLAKTCLFPLTGSSRPPRRSNRALPEVPVPAPEAPDDENDEVITTSQAPPAETPANATITTDVMRGWMNQFTGRAEAPNVGIRAPTDDEISQLQGMFPGMSRNVIVAALQRR